MEAKTESLECALERAVLSSCAKKRVLQDPAAYGAISAEAAEELGIMPDPAVADLENDVWAESEIVFRADELHRRT